jgi:hypothetical protein
MPTEKLTRAYENAIERVYNKKIFMVAYQITVPSDQFCFQLQFQFQAESPGLYDILENRKRL